MNLFQIGSTLDGDSTALHSTAQLIGPGIIHSFPVFPQSPSTSMKYEV